MPSEKGNRLDRETSLEQLVLAQNHLAAGAGLISSQEALIERLRRKGRPIDDAERVLRLLIATQSAQFADLERLRRKLEDPAPVPFSSPLVG
jgi:hypothetical protein